MSVVSSDGVVLAVHDLGGAGPPLLACHGAGFHGRVWAPMAGRLGEDFRVWSVDLRGHGDSPAPEGWDFRWAGFADDVLAAVDGMGLTRPVGLGHSMGATALVLAEQARPGVFAALYIFEPILFPADRSEAPLDDHPLVGGALRRQAVFGSRAAAREAFAVKAPFDTLDPAALSAYVEHGFADLPDGTVGLKCRSVDEAEAYRMGRAHSAFAGLGAVACPVIVARGGRSPALPPHDARRVMAALPAGRLETFEGLGHLGPLEDPVRVAAAVAASLAPG